VVLDRVESVWDELRKMDELLWRHSFDNDTVVTALPVAENDVRRAKDVSAGSSAGRGIAGRLTNLGRSRDEIEAARLLAERDFATQARTTPPSTLPSTPSAPSARAARSTLA
jgi:hypothetical protein